MTLEHFWSDMGTGTPQSKEAYNEKPSNQTVQQAMTLGSVQVGNAQVICQDKKYIVVIVRVADGIGANFYRDMYRIV